MYKLFLTDQIKAKIQEFIQKKQTPFYLYDSEDILLKCRNFTDIPFTPKSIHFALMANPNPQFLSIIKEAGLKVFVNSINHLDIVLKLGYHGEEIVFAASAMDEATMRKVESCNSLAILDSPGQLKRWSSLFPNTGVGIRCNIGEQVMPQNTLGGYFIGKESRLGFMVEEVRELKGNRSIIGLHTYVGTNIMDIKYFLECYEHIAGLAELFPNLEFLDFGGGFGIGINPDEQINLQEYGKDVTNLMNRLSEKLGRQIKLMLEPGRIIGGEAGYFVCEVIDVKDRGDHQFIGVNASCAQFPRPLFYSDDAFHPVEIIHQGKALDLQTERLSSVFGCSTYSRDFLAHNIMLPEVSVGDLVVLGHAGSYSSSAYTKFLGFPEAEEYFI